ncbi:mannose-1-phosphate guanylyltransferase RfbM [Lachnospiraceae bacterium]|nr:mannose-1-phosphate guanylyltransferase RfbM [Lachnospiraceae bacterium]
MNIILLSGGSGKRLWPLSNDVRSKQFIPIFETEAGNYESMVQRVYRQIRKADPDAEVTIATARSQVSAICHQLGGEVSISVEPCRRDTFPAISLTAAYLKDVRGISEEEAVLICPVDPYVEMDYFEALKKMEKQVYKNEANLVLLGIEPAYPSEKYGYIIPENAKDISLVSRFQEKPDKKRAEKYIREGALWNGGVFACRLGYLLKRAHQFMEFTDYQELFDKYSMLERISFDYRVVEQESRIQVMRFSGRWKDLGTWNTLTEAMDKSCIGDARMNEECENVHIINELDIPILAMGLQGVVISASPQGVLVSDKEQSSYIKPFVDGIDRQTMFAEKSWGSYRVLNVGENSLTIKVTLNPGHRMNYHSHKNRNEVWVAISGKGRTVVDGMEQVICPGDVVTMEAGCRHTVIADRNLQLQLVEIQLGKEISVHDKQKYSMEY